MKHLVILLLLFSGVNSFSYSLEISSTDSTLADTTDQKKQPLKLIHAEPLYIDLIRDLGARKGEREWNVGLGLTDNLNFDEVELLVEYEWAVANRLGLEIEVPVSLYSFNQQATGSDQPSDRIEGLKTAIQWTFLVHEKARTSMALGYINELTFIDINRYGKESFIDGNVFNPFLVVAKRWGQNYHSLIYTGPSFYKPFRQNGMQFNYEINSSFHYMIPRTRNFVGLELNKELNKNDFDMIIRPQMRVEITGNLLAGVVVGIPFKRENERFSSFLRLIYEPKH